MDKVEFVLVTIAKEGVVKEAERGSGDCCSSPNSWQELCLLPNVT